MMYSSEALIEDIEIDKQVALSCLQRPAYQRYANDSSFKLGDSDLKTSL